MFGGARVWPIVELKGVGKKFSKKIDSVTRTLCISEIFSLVNHK